eukprot:14072414-Alexandrium_andersonii.AAC.1
MNCKWRPQAIRHRVPMGFEWRTGECTVERASRSFHSLVRLKMAKPLAKPRIRATLEPAAIAQILEPYVKHPSWLKYPEQLDACMHVPTLKAHRCWILKLRSAAPNLAFSQQQMRGAFRLM